MKSLTTALSLAAVLMTAACAGNPPITPNDTGNMAYPNPVPQGNIAVTRPAPADTGNMALPSRAQGNSLPNSRY